MMKLKQFRKIILVVMALSPTLASSDDSAEVNNLIPSMSMLISSKETSTLEYKVYKSGTGSENSFDIYSQTCDKKIQTQDEKEKNRNTQEGNIEQEKALDPTIQNADDESLECKIWTLVKNDATKQEVLFLSKVPSQIYKKAKSNTFPVYFDATMIGLTAVGFGTYGTKMFSSRALAAFLTLEFALISSAKFIVHSNKIKAFEQATDKEQEFSDKLAALQKGESGSLTYERTDHTLIKGIVSRKFKFSEAFSAK